MLDYRSLLKENNDNAKNQLIKELKIFEDKYWRRPETYDEKLMVYTTAYKKLIGPQAKSVVAKAKRALLIDVFHTHCHTELINLATKKVAEELRAHDPISVYEDLPMDCTEVLCVDGKNYRMGDIDFESLAKCIHTTTFLTFSNLTERLSKQSMGEMCKQHLIFTTQLEESNHTTKPFSMEDGTVRNISVVQFDGVPHLAKAIIRHHLLDLEAKRANINLEELKSSLQQVDEE